MCTARLGIILLGLSILWFEPLESSAAQGAQDPSRETVLIGEATLSDMRIKLELEPAKPMSMPMGQTWMEVVPSPSERFHVEVKPEDPQSGTRLPYADVSFSAVNQDSGQSISLQLHPMWGSSGLHYANNSDLPDGAYLATVLVGVPTFGRAPADRQRWTTPTQAQFAFRLQGGLLVEAGVVSAGGNLPGEVPPVTHDMPGMR